MRLGVARLCLDCDEVYDAEECPACSSETFVFLTRWVKPVNQEAAEASAADAAKTSRASRARSKNVDAYRAIVRPDRARRKGSGLLARGAVGLALVGLARMAFRASRPDAQTKPEP
jgi:hypothetical protein